MSTTKQKVDGDELRGMAHRVPAGAYKVDGDELRCPAGDAHRGVPRLMA